MDEISQLKSNGQRRNIRPRKDSNGVREKGHYFLAYCILDHDSLCADGMDDVGGAEVRVEGAHVLL